MMDTKLIVDILKHGGVGVLATDTLYGIVGSALIPKTVEKIYRLRKRNKRKPMIILIGSMSDLKLFGVSLAKEEKSMLTKFWPGKVSVIFPCELKKFAYLHRGGKTLAFRLPKKNSLKSILQRAGPLVAPTANLEGEPPAKTISEAKKYFDDRIDFYINEGKKDGKPSKLIKIVEGKKIILRN